jgi:hypothetical protein
MFNSCVSPIFFGEIKFSPKLVWDWLKMRISSQLVLIIVLVISTLFLSVLFDNLTGYYGILFSPDKESFPQKETEEQVHLMFAVSPAHPAMYWRVSTADYYDGFGWSRTTSEGGLEEFPKAQNDSEFQVFTVEMNITEEAVSFPVPTSKTSVLNLTLSPDRDHELRLDDLADVYGIRILEREIETEMVYQVMWQCIDYPEIDGRIVSLNGVPQEIRSIYLQLPSLPEEVWELAENLKHYSYNVLDQILADIQYLKTYFDYDVDLLKGRTKRIINRDWVFSYIQSRKGVCVDAATALTVILRCQGIPARISFGFKPERTYGNKTHYYSTGAHAETEVYLPPYGWVSFDATPPRADFPRIEVAPIKAEGYSGEDVFYHLRVTNKRNVTDRVKISMHGKEEWESKTIPEELIVEPFGTGDALMKITIPENASSGETNVITVNAKSFYVGTEFSALAVTEVGKTKRLPTITKISSVDEAIFRDGFLSFEGEVYSENHEVVHDVPILALFLETEEEKSIVFGKNFSSIGHFRMDCQVPLYAERGSHNLFAVSLGDSEYTPSFSSPVVVKVHARTSFKLNVKSPSFVGDQPTIYGYLLFDDGTPVQNASITLETFFQDDPSIKGKWQTITDANGVFFTVSEQKFAYPGLFELRVAFLGTMYINGSNATQIIKVHTGTPTIRSLTGNLLIRGEVCLVRGTVYLNDTGIWKEPVTIALDGHSLTTVETNLNGHFSYAFEMDPEEKLGNHTLSFVVQSRTLEFSQKVNVMAKTEFSINSFKKVSGTERLSLSASLLDDHELPIPEAEISMKHYGLAGKTDRNGNVSFLLDTIRFLPENISLTLRFEGSNIYLPTATSVTAAAEPAIPITFLLPFVISAAVVIALLTNRPLFQKKIETVPKTKQQDKQEDLLRINFPDIRNPFPNLWGVGEKLRIRCCVRAPNGRIRKKAKERTLKLFVDGKNIGRSALLKESATFSQIFEKKGAYQLTAQLIDMSQTKTVTAETTLRVVDYREEIVDLYGAFLEFMNEESVEIRDEMTAREIESLLLNTGRFDAIALQKATQCFEKTEYSSHSIERNDYEEIYLSLEELKIDAQKTD